MGGTGKRVTGLERIGNPFWNPYGLDETPLWKQTETFFGGCPYLFYVHKHCLLCRTLWPGLPSSLWHSCGLRVDRKGNQLGNPFRSGNA
jgi:hypothetical protein